MSLFLLVEGFAVDSVLLVCEKCSEVYSEEVASLVPLLLHLLSLVQVVSVALFDLSLVLFVIGFVHIVLFLPKPVHCFLRGLFLELQPEFLFFCPFVDVRVFLHRAFHGFQIEPVAVEYEVIPLVDEIGVDRGIVDFVYFDSTAVF